MIQAGDTLRGRYRILRLLGRGGMADVYLAFDQRRYVQVAIKIMREDLAEDPDFVARFAREAQALARLDHPNIVRFYSFEREGLLAFLVMDYVDGLTLRTELAQRRGPLTLAETTHVLRDIGSALFYAHSEGVIHRDLKPGNIMLARDGRALLTDFGIAKAMESATVTTMAAGTPAYMSPEQILGRPLDVRTDIYSLGVMLYQMVSGRRPFTGQEAGLTGTGTAARLREAHLRLPPPNPRQFNPNLPPEIASIILRALAKQPEQRWPDVRQLVSAWEQAAAGRIHPTAPLRWRHATPSTPVTPPPVQPPPPPPPPRSSTPAPPRSHRSRTAWLVMGGVLLLAAFFILLMLMRRPAPQTSSPTSVTTSPTTLAAPSATTGISPTPLATLSPAATSSAPNKSLAVTQTAVAKETETSGLIATRVAATHEALKREATATAEAQKQRATNTVAQATQTAVARQNQDRDAIQSVIQRYGDVKVEGMTHLNANALAEVLMDPVLEQKRQVICWLQKNNAYYTYENRSVDIVDVLFHGPNEATVYAWLGEHIQVHKDGKVDDWGYERYKAVYHLRKIHGKWKIDCLHALEDKEDFSPQCEVKFSDENPCLQ